MKRGLLIACVAVASLSPALLSRHTPETALSRGIAATEREPATRLISMAPSITEVVFDLGLGKELAGVTRYCDWPPEALTKPRIGGYLDPNYEAILALQPGMVLLLSEQASRRPFFDELGIPSLIVNHSDVGGILNSILEIGRACGADSVAARRVAELRARLDRVRSRVADLPRPRVMVTVGRGLVQGALGDMYISGRDGYYNQLIELAGGVNAFRERTAALPSISAEGIRELDPEVIVEMVPELSPGGPTAQQFIDSWQEIARGVPAVEQHRVYVFTGTWAVRPSPRFIDLLERLAAVIHPQAVALK